MRLPLVVELLRDISAPHWRAHRVRTLLSVLGVALGVASVVGMSSVNESVLDAFRRMVDTASGDSALEITSPTGSVPEPLIEAAGAAPGVQAAAGVVESFVPLADRPDEVLYLLGVDFLGSPVWETQFPRKEIQLTDEVEFLSQPDSVLLGAELMERNGWHDGDAIAVLTSAGARTLHVRGRIGPVPVARLFGGALAVMDLPACQKLLGREGEVDRIAVQTAAGADIAGVARALTTALGSGVEVAPPEARGKQADRLMLTLRFLLATMSACAVIVGTLIVFHTVSVSVEQRRRAFALVNVAGVSPRTIVQLCLIETALLAVLGVLVGLAGGRGLALVSAGSIGAAADGLWAHLDVSHVVASVAGTVVGVVAAIVSAMGAAWIAIRRSLSSTTMEALRPVSESDGSAARPGRGIAIGLLALVSSWFVALTPPGLDYAVLVALVLTGNCLAYLGGALLAPGLVALAGRLLRPIAARMPLPVELAFENLARDLRRSGATVATIIVAVAMAATVTGTVESFNRAVLGWIHQRFDADLFVGAGTRFQLYGGTPMAAEMGAVLRATPGVASAEPFRVRRIEVGGQPVFLQGLDLDSRLAHGGLAMVDGELADVAAALRAGTGALVSDNLAYQQRLQRGDQVTIATAHGPHSYRVEGIYTDYLASLDLGAVTVGYDEFVRQWDDHVVNLFRLWLQPGAEATTVRADLLRRLGGARGYFVLTAGQFRESVERLLNGFFAAAWGLQLVAGLVGVIGVVNAQLATVLDRSREIQALRTIGVARRDITRATLTECALLGTIGGVGGVMVGTTIGAQIVLVALHLVTGLRIPFRTAASPLVAGVIAAAVVSALAGWVPARAAAQVELPRGPSE